MEPGKERRLLAARLERGIRRGGYDGELDRLADAIRARRTELGIGPARVVKRRRISPPTAPVTAPTDPPPVIAGDDGLRLPPGITMAEGWNLPEPLQLISCPPNAHNSRQVRGTWYRNRDIILAGQWVVVCPYPGMQKIPDSKIGLVVRIVSLERTWATVEILGNIASPPPPLGTVYLKAKMRIEVLIKLINEGYKFHASRT